MTQAEIPRLFISYRRADTGAEVERLFEDLDERLAPNQLFWDREGIQGGEEWRGVLSVEVGRASFLFAVIGDEWLGGPPGEAPVRRIDDPKDWVRLEVEGALDRDIDVLPLLVERAPEPDRSWFAKAPKLVRLTDKQHLKLMAVSWDDDVRNLVDLLHKPHGFRLREQVAVARSEDIEELRHEIERPELRLFLLWGPPGSGKTQLAKRLQEELLAFRPDEQSFPEAVTFVDVSKIKRSVAEAVAAALGVKESTRTALDAIVEYLSDRAHLVTLDNCEAATGECLEIAVRLAREAPRAKVLATSQIDFGDGHDFRFARKINPFPKPDKDRPWNAAELRRERAVRVFLHQLHKARREVTLTDSEARAVAVICHWFDGLPLAMRLGVRWRKYATMEELAARLEHDRPSGLVDHIRRSYRLIENAPERQLLRAVAVFASAWTDRAAAALVGEHPDDGAVRGRLDSLVDRALVEHSAGPAGESRFHLLESIRHFALQELEAAGEADAVRDRHLDFFLEWVRESESGLKGGEEQAQWLDRLATSHDDLLAAIDHSCATRDGSEALEIASRLRRFWFIRGHLSRGIHTLDHALDCHQNGRHDLLRARALKEVGILARLRGDLDYAAQRLEEADRLLSDLLADVADEDSSGRREVLGEVGATWNAQGILWFRRDEFDRAQQRLEAAHGIAEDLDDDNLRAWTLNGLGDVAVKRGHRDEGIALHMESLRAKERVRDMRGVAMSKHKLGTLEENPVRSRELLEDALRIRRELGQRPEAATTLGALLRLDLQRDDVDPQELRDRAAEMLDVRIEIGRKDWLAEAMFLGGVVAIRGEEPEVGTRALAAAAVLRSGRALGPADAGLEESALASAAERLQAEVVEAERIAGDQEIPRDTAIRLHARLLVQADG